MKQESALSIHTYKYSLPDYLIYIMVATSSFLVFNVKGHELLMILQFLFCIVMAFYYKKLFFIKNALVNAVFIGMVLTFCSALLNPVQLSYTKTAVYMTVVMIPVYFSTAYVTEYLRDHPSKWEVIRNALKLMCLVQIVWCFIQFMLYKVFLFDLNQFCFVDTLHLVESATFFKGNLEFMPSGLCWHPIIMAPILILAYFLFNHIVMKIVVLLEAMLIGNATVLIVVLLCIFMDLVRSGLRILRKGRVRKVILISIIAAAAVFLILLLFTHLLDPVWEKLSLLLERIVGASGDESTEAHIRYYSGYPLVVQNSSILQFFFGYGEGCSGYPYGMMYDQYRYLSSWAVETDVMNILVSRGVIGFLLFYGFLAQIAVRGRKIDYRYVFFVICIIVGGITYNVQFSWLVFVELLMTAAISDGISLFGEPKHRRIWRA